MSQPRVALHVEGLTALRARCRSIYQQIVASELSAREWVLIELTFEAASTNAVEAIKRATRLPDA